jgi:hypothetical protein
MKKSSEILIRQFKDKSSHWFVRDAHYFLNENNEIIWAAGETDKEELRNALIDFIKRNKKTYVPREKGILEKEPKVFDEIIPVGKLKGKTVQQALIEDKKYLSWMRDNFNFNSAQEKLKQQIIEILK